MKLKSLIPTVACMGFLFVTGCGKDGHKSSSSDSPATQASTTESEEDGEHIAGTYLARFTTLNSNINGTIPGSLTFKREEGQDRMIAYLRLFAGGPLTVHPQAVYAGKRCPNLKDDTNGDGFIDYNEAIAVVGKVLIPLDANINSQTAGRNFYPLADLSGSYSWERIASFNRFYSDLRDTNGLYADDLYKLSPEEKFDFAGKVVMVHGIQKDVALPDTVEAPARKTPQQTLPIVCGIIQKVTWEPGSIENSETMSDDPQPTRTSRTRTSN